MDLKALQQEFRQAQKNYVRNLINLGYVFQRKGSYEDTEYWAILSDYYMTFDERWEKEIEEGELVWDGTIWPEMYPTGAFIRVDSAVRCETDCPETTDYLLDDDSCSLEYLSQ